MPVLKLSFFGPGKVLSSPDKEIKIRSRKEFALLAYLAVENEHNHSRQALMGLLWPELEESQARNNLRVSLARLRKVVNHSRPPLIHADRHNLSFDSAQLDADGFAWMDVAEFGRLLSIVNSHDHVNPTACPTCLADMVKVAELYQGEFLHGFHLDGCELFEHWLLVQRERYHMQIMALLPKLEFAYMAAQDWNAAEKTVRKRLALDPLDEDAHRILMQVLTLNGLRNAALAHYDICARTLDEELGVPPDEETTAIAEQIRNGDLEAIRKLTPSQPQGGQAGAANLSFRASNPLSASSSHQPAPYAVLSRLEPLPDQALFGVDAAMETIGGAIDAEDRSWLVAIEGIGGLGKTTLANALVKNKVAKWQASGTSASSVDDSTEAGFVAAGAETDSSTLQFQDIGWVSAKQEEYLPDRGIQSTGRPALDEESLMDQLLAQLADGPYPTGSSQEKRLALTQLLKEKSCLVVVDNLETAIDYQALLPLMRQLANPSKFLITSRMSLAGQGDVFAYSLSEVAEEDALAFLRHEAESRGMVALAAASDDQLRSIYETVGGNPLALKLVLGQLQFLPLDQILNSLRQADSDRSDQLYTYIYWEAWQMLDATARHLWLCLPVVPNATFAQLQNISGLDVDALQPAIMKLRNLSLIEVGGDLNEIRYRLHRLTETFLMHEVVKWQEMDQALGQESSSDEAAYFVQRVLHMVAQWNEAEAVHEVDVTILDHEYESVVKAISLGLALEQGWTTVKPLIIGFTPFMERRGHWHTWHSILERAIDAAHRSEDLDGEITLTALLARLCQRESRPKDVVNYYRRVIRMARRSGNRFEEARACSNLGYAYIDEGRWWRSEVLSCHALEIFEELGGDHGRAHTHNHLGVLYTRQCRWVVAEQHLNIACKIWEEQKNGHSLISGYINLGLLFVEMENPEQAIRYLSKAYHSTEITGESSSTARIWNNMSAAYQLKLDWENAKLYAHKAEELFRKQSDYVGLASVWKNLGLIAFGCQCHDLARNYLEKSLETHLSLNNPAEIRSIQEDLKRVAA